MCKKVYELHQTSKCQPEKPYIRWVLPAPAWPLYLQGLQTVIYACCRLTHWGWQSGCSINTLRLTQNDHHFPDRIFKYIFFNENVWIWLKISLKFVADGPINDIPALVQTKALRRQFDKPLSEPMMDRLPTHICITRPQCVNVVWKHMNGHFCGVCYTPTMFISTCQWTEPDLLMWWTPFPRHYCLHNELSEIYWCGGLPSPDIIVSTCQWTQRDLLTPFPRHYCLHLPMNGARSTGVVDSLPQTLLSPPANELSEIYWCGGLPSPDIIVSTCQWTQRDLLVWWTPFPRHYCLHLPMNGARSTGVVDSLPQTLLSPPANELSEIYWCGGLPSPDIIVSTCQWTEPDLLVWWTPFPRHYCLHLPMNWAKSTGVVDSLPLTLLSPPANELSEIYWCGGLPSPDIIVSTCQWTQRDLLVWWTPFPRHYCLHLPMNSARSTGVVDSLPQTLLSPPANELSQIYWCGGLPSPDIIVSTCQWTQPDLLVWWTPFPRHCETLPWVFMITCAYLFGWVYVQIVVTTIDEVM